MMCHKPSCPCECNILTLLAMMQNAIRIIENWLDLCGYRSIDRKGIELAFLSHPDIGSAKAITDTLASFGVENAAIAIPFEAVGDLELPFLAYLKHGYEEQFVLLKPVGNNQFEIDLGETGKRKEILNAKQLQQMWTGVVILIDKKEEPRRRLPVEIQPWFFLMVGILLTLLVTANGVGGFFVCYFALGLLGFAIAVLLVKQQMGLTGGIGAKFCSVNKNADCTTVLNSPAATIIGNLGWSDVGIIYFATQIAVQLVQHAFAQSVYIVLCVISQISALFIVYSLYQQKVKIKKWCPLCLGILAILFGQAVVATLANGFFVPIQIDTVKGLLFVFATGALAAVGWFLLKPQLKNSLEQKNLSVESLSFRRNYHLLLPFLRNQPPVSSDKNLRKVQVGNADGQLRITVVTNPMCNSCIALHKVLEKLCAGQDQLCVELVFYVPLEKDDPRTIVAGHFVSLDKKELPQALAQWYHAANPDKFIRENKCSLLMQCHEDLRRNRDWCHDNNIFVTPTVLINGRRFPSFYRPTDIEYFVESLLAEHSSAQYNERAGNNNLVLVDNT
jgi:uncharacterized membrane protein